MRVIFKYFSQPQAACPGRRMECKHGRRSHLPSPRGRGRREPAEPAGFKCQFVQTASAAQSAQPRHQGAETRSARIPQPLVRFGIIRVDLRQRVDCLAKGRVNQLFHSLGSRPMPFYTMSVRSASDDSIPARILLRTRENFRRRRQRPQHH